MGDVLNRMSGLNQGRHFVYGTPKVVADHIEKWMDEDGIDGINLAPISCPSIQRGILSNWLFRN